MKTLKFTQIEHKYNCFKERITELKKLSENNENCECDRFTICQIETGQMIDFLFRELEIYDAALESACDNAFCKDKGLCDKECNEKCIKAAMTKVLHSAEIKNLNKNGSK